MALKNYKKRYIDIVGNLEKTEKYEENKTHLWLH